MVIQSLEIDYRWPYYAPFKKDDIKAITSMILKLIFSYPILSVFRALGIPWTPVKMELRKLKDSGQSSAGNLDKRSENITDDSIRVTIP